MLCALVLSTAACGGTSADGGTPDGRDGGRTITVFAAASLNETFTDLARRFETENPGTQVRLNFAGSSDLVTQLSEGAPADVLAAADTRTMDRAADAELLAQDPVVFATNTLQLAVPADNPAGVSTLADAAAPGVRTVVCAEQVPCGAATRLVEEAAGVQLSPVSEESSVTDVLGKVSSGEADAGLVYVSDVRRAGDAVRGIDVPESAEVVNSYPVAPLASSADPATAGAFVEFVTGPTGRSVLGDAGFGVP